MLKRLRRWPNIVSMSRVSWGGRSLPVNANICITFVQCLNNVEDVGPGVVQMLYKYHVLRSKDVNGSSQNYVLSTNTVLPHNVPTTYSISYLGRNSVNSHLHP